MECVSDWRGGEGVKGLRAGHFHLVGMDNKMAERECKFGASQI